MGRSVVTVWEDVYRERRAARAALLDEPAEEGGAGGPVARAAWLDAAPFRVTRESWSPDLDAYAAGAIGAHELRCVECGAAPCACGPCPACGWRRAPGTTCPACQ